MANDEIKYGTCEACGRTDVPLCPHCGKRVPHGYTWGTWLPCWCQGIPQDEKQILEIVLSNAKKEGGDKE